MKALPIIATACLLIGYLLGTLTEYDYSPTELVQATVACNTDTREGVQYYIASAGQVVGVECVNGEKLVLQPTR